MASVVDTITSAPKPIVWLNDAAYSQRLMGGGKTNWFETAEYVAYRRKAAGLLRPDIIVFSVGDFAKAWVDKSPELREAMGSKKRTVVPLRTLVADEDMREKLLETVKGLRAIFGAQPLVLQLPSPRRWIAEAFHLAFGDDSAVEFGDEEVDTAAVYFAEFIRSLSETGINGIILQEPEGVTLTPAQVALYQPIINLAGHYRWDLGILLPAGTSISGELAGFGFAIADKPVAGVASGLIIPGGFWKGEAPPPAPSGGFRYVEIPRDEVPEHVLERLAVLRS